jgi:hypothetical protein
VGNSIKRFTIERIIGKLRESDIPLEHVAYSRRDKQKEWLMGTK